MRKALFAILALAVLSLPAFAQQTGVVPITVTNTAANIVADGTCSRVSCTAVIVKENAATPTAIFSVTPRGSTTAINLPAGGSFEFDASATNPIIAGQVLGTVVATTSGPFNFVAIESPARPSNANIPASSGGGGGGSPGGSPTQIQYNLGGSFAGIPNSDAFETGQVILAPANPTNTDTAGLIVLTTATAAGSPTVNDSLYVTSTLTDNAAIGGPARGAFFEGELLGSDVGGDGAYGAVVYVINDASGGNPSELSGFNVLPLTNFGFAATTQTGIHIQDQAQNTQASATNAALLIDDQTAGANVYAIKTGLGQVAFGDTTSVASDGLDSDGGFSVITNGPSSSGAYTTIAAYSEAFYNGNTDGGNSEGANFAAFNETTHVVTNVIGETVQAVADDGGGSATNAIGLVVSAVSGGVTNTGLSIAPIVGGSTNYSIKTGSGIVSLGDVLETAPVLFASLGTPTNGSIVYCSNCDTPVTAGVACTSAGDMAGAAAIYARSGWECF